MAEYVRLVDSNARAKVIERHAHYIVVEYTHASGFGHQVALSNDEFEEDGGDEIDSDED
jgi:hypothetical protein